MKVFISWSGERSKLVAEALRTWLPGVVQAIDPWMSASDLHAGSQWQKELASNLDDTRFGILVLTPENLDSSWVIFEAGALSKKVDEARVVPYLVDLRPTDVAGPLSVFQAVAADKEGTWKMVKSVVSALGSGGKPIETLQPVFDAMWPRLEKALRVLTKSQDPKPRRSIDDRIDELLRTVRALEQRFSRPPPVPSLAVDGSRDWIKVLVLQLLGDRGELSLNDMINYAQVCVDTEELRAVLEKLVSDRLLEERVSNRGGRDVLTYDLWGSVAP